jgi:hypothetical protein
MAAVRELRAEVLMNTRKSPQESLESQPEVAHPATSHRHPVHEAGGAAGGALAGAALGSMAGPAGAAAGAILGGVVGAFAAKIADEEADRVSLHDGELDAIIGVNGGEIGASNLEHPPALRGTFSAGSSGGGGGGGGAGAGGPISSPDD